MESTRIPKPSGYKPRTKLPVVHAKDARTGPSAAPMFLRGLDKLKAKPLSTINENKGAPNVRSVSPDMQNSRADVQSFRALALRRRSKSVTDLRTFPAKPLKVENFRGAAAKPSIQKTAKRALENKNDNDSGASKPKVPRTRKIPDWDYKSRFLESQKKHTLVVDELKKLKEMTSNLSELEANLKNATQSNAELHRMNLKLTEEKKMLQLKETQLLAENLNIKMERDLLEKNYEELQRQYTALDENHIEQTKKLEEFVLQEKDLMETLHTVKNELNNANKRLSLYEEQFNNNEAQRRILHNNIQDLKGNIRVFCRVRPPINAEEQEKLQCSILFPDECTVEIRKSRESVSYLGRPTDLRQEFNFDRVFPPEAQQVEVFEELAQLVQSALDGYHVCVFAYGQTGAGKTYTMEGTPQNNGMIPRTIDLIFDKIKNFEKFDWHYEVSASFLEIYNENIRDLLEPNSTLSYEPRYNEGRGITVSNLKIVQIESAEVLKRLVAKSQSNRATASTDFNLHSSRSHSITKIDLKGENKKSNINYRGSIHLVDLAGSESAKTSTDQRMVETKNINKSLTELGKVMLALHNKEGHVPYRNSKLTFLLQSCLGGNSKTLMFVNIAPFEDTFNESVNSLRFAAKVKEVKIKVKKNKTYSSTNN